jgi:hypothetical protein
MGNVSFAASGTRVVVEMHAEGDPYGHDGCDSADCHWSPASFETQYLDLDAARALRNQLDAAIKAAQKATR